MAVNVSAGLNNNQTTTTMNKNFIHKNKQGYHQIDVNLMTLVNDRGGLRNANLTPLVPEKDDAGYLIFPVTVNAISGAHEDRYVHIEVVRTFGRIPEGIKLAPGDVIHIDKNKANNHFNNLAPSKDLSERIITLTTSAAAQGKTEEQLAQETEAVENIHDAETLNAEVEEIPDTEYTLDDLEEPAPGNGDSDLEIESYGDDIPPIDAPEHADVPDDGQKEEAPVPGQDILDSKKSKKQIAKELMALKSTELQSLADAQGVDKTGRKADIVRRLTGVSP